MGKVAPVHRESGTDHVGTAHAVLAVDAPAAMSEVQRQLLLANQAILGELSLPQVLQRITGVAREVVNARYAALGVTGADGTMEQFVVDGIDEATQRLIGDPPRGRGMLGALISDHRAIRVPRISEDPRSSGFPPHHPAMESFLGVPIRSRQGIYGNLYLTDSESGAFSAEDEELIGALATTAGIAIQNARLYDDSRRRQRWALATAEINANLFDPDGDRDSLQQIVDMVLELADADVVSLVRPTEDPQQLLVVVAAGRAMDEIVGLKYPIAHSLARQAMSTGRGLVLDRPEGHGYQVHLVRFVDVGPVLAVPLAGRSGARSAMIVGRVRGRAQFGDADLEMAEAFSNHAAIALELAEVRADRERLALFEDRDRIARDLHDHVIQRLFAAGLSLQGMAAGADPVRGARLTDVVETLDATIQQIRTTIFELREPADGAQGARAAIVSVVTQASEALGFMPRVVFTGPLDTVVDGGMLDDVQAVLREALTNALRHARATDIRVEAKAAAGALTLTVVDDGVGIGSSGRRSGLHNLAERASRRDGTCRVSRGARGGTELVWRVPLG